MTELRHLWLLLQSYLTPKVIVLLTLTSAIMAIGSILMMPLILCKLPPDYFNHEKPHLLVRIKTSSPLKILALIAKNLVGSILLFAGILMLFLPGQGVLTILIGMVMMDFPGKFRMERRVVANPKILSAINWLRARRGHPEMQVDLTL